MKDTTKTPTNHRTVHAEWKSRVLPRFSTVPSFVQRLCMTMAGSLKVDAREDLRSEDCSAGVVDVGPCLAVVSVRQWVAKEPACKTCSSHSH